MPPVSSRTISRSAPLDELRAAAGSRRRAPGSTRTGRRFANSSSPLRSPSRPCSGRGASGSVVSHFGPPTAPSSTASAERQRSSTSGSSGTPCSSIERPPTGSSVDLEGSAGRARDRVRAAASAAPIDLRPDPVAGKRDDLRRAAPGGCSWRRRPYGPPPEAFSCACSTWSTRSVRSVRSLLELRDVRRLSSGLASRTSRASRPARRASRARWLRSVASRCGCADVV